MKNIFKLWLFRMLTESAEVRCCNYHEGDKLIRDGWILSDKEDFNFVLGKVYVERRIFKQ